MCPPSSFQSAENRTHQIVEPAHVSGALRLAFKHHPNARVVLNVSFAYWDRAYRFYRNDKVVVLRYSLFKQVIVAGNDLYLAGHLTMYA